MTHRLVLLFVITWWCIAAPTYPVFITGHVKFNANMATLSVKKMSIFVRGDGKLLARAVTSSKGNFEVTFTPKDEKSFDFFCAANGSDTLLIRSVRNFEKDNPDMTFYMPAKEKKNSSGQVICIKCEKADKVYQIQYDPVAESGQKPNSTVDTVDVKNRIIHKSQRPLQIARYYCARDKVQF